MTAALIIGGVVCTALSTAGGFITDLKIVVLTVIEVITGKGAC